MTLSKLSTKRAPLLLVCLAASLLPVLFSSLWMDKRLNPDSTTIMLLAVICLAFCLDWGLSWKNSPKARQVKFSETDVCPSPPFFPVPKNKLNLYTREALRLYPKTLTISCFLVLAARWNYCILLLLISLGPLDILAYNLLNKELVKCSRDVQNQSGWHKFLSSANQVGAQPKQWMPFKPTLLGCRYQNRQAFTGIMFLEFVNMTARAMVMLLAIYAFIIKDFFPIYAMIYCILPRLFFATLQEAVNGNLSKQDIIDSLNFVGNIKNSQGDKAAQ